MKSFLRILICCFLLLGLGLAKFNVQQVQIGIDTAGDSIVFSNSDMQTDGMTKALVEGLNEQKASVTVYVHVPSGANKSDYLIKKVKESFNEIRRDYPNIFWVGLGEYNLRWVDYDVNTVSLSIGMNYAYNSAQVEEKRAKINRIMAGVQNSAPEGMAQKAKYYHDWIVNNASFSMEYSAQSSGKGHEYMFNIDGVFLNGSAVCEGYAKAYKLLCDKGGIPCRIVYGTRNGESHAWNYINLGGDWYFVDCTADDPIGGDGSILRWDYFLKGSQSVAEGRKITDVYQEDNGSYPHLSSSGYQS